MNTKPVVFIPAAGLGTRLEHLTKNTPKALVSYQGKPLLEHLLLRFKEQGFLEIVINVHHFSEQITAFLNQNQNFGLHIRISDESNRLLNTGGALKKALPLLEGTEYVLVHNVDIISDMDYLHFCAQIPKRASALLAVRNRISSRQFIFDEQMRLRAWVNHQSKESKGCYEKTMKSLSFSGIHVLKIELIRHFAKLYADDDVFSVVAAYINSVASHEIYGYLHDQDTWQDLGKISDFEKM